MDKGWIKVYRQIQEHWVWRDPEKLRAWLDLILMANHESQKFETREGLITIRRGQFVTSIEKLSRRWGWSKNRTYRFLKMLESDNMLKRKANRYSTTLTIVNYDKFQDKQNANGTPKRTPNESPSGSPDGSRTRIYKNEKEYKEEAVSLLDEAPAFEEEEPPVPGAVRMPNGGWNYMPELDEVDDE